MIMIVLCLSCAVFAAWLAVPRPAARQLRSRLASTASDAPKESAAVAERRRRRRRSGTYLVIMIIVLILIVATGYLTNGRSAVLAGAAQAVGATAVRLVAQAPRATSKVMAVLPAFGIGVGYLLGGDPARWLLSGPAGWACLLIGVLLACAGVLWIEALLLRVRRGMIRCPSIS